MENGDPLDLGWNSHRIEEREGHMSSRLHVPRIESGTVVALGMIGAAVALLALGRSVGWDATWRALGVTPLQPPFFDMHVINAYAACASKGVDAYAVHACNEANFNIPPAWLLLGFLGIDGSDSSWLSGAVIAAAATVMVLLARGRPWHHGVMALTAIMSPSVLMGVERGNLDLLILTLVGSAALIYDERKFGQTCAAVTLLGLGIALKLFPMFCISVSARFSKRTFVFTFATAVLSLIYLSLTLKYIFLIHRNVPTTFILSYGYKVIFLGVDHIRNDAGLSPIGLAETWVPAFTAGLVLNGAAVVALNCFRNRRGFCLVDTSVAGTAFLFGAGIYCGTYLLGTNFIYRLMFLLLCVPQFHDWQSRAPREGRIEVLLFGIVLAVLWLNGNANGHSGFLLLPQLLDWFLFFSMAAVLMLNFLRTSTSSALALRSSPAIRRQVERPRRDAEHKE